MECVYAARGVFLYLPLPVEPLALHLYNKARDLCPSNGTIIALPRQLSCRTLSSQAAREGPSAVMFPVIIELRKLLPELCHTTLQCLSLEILPDFGLKVQPHRQTQDRPPPGIKFMLNWQLVGV